MSHKLYETEDACWYIENEIPDMLEGVFIHLEVFKWSHNRVKKNRKLWSNIVDLLRKNGVKGIYALPPSEYEERLIKMFNFEYTGLLFNGYKIMRYK